MTSKRKRHSGEFKAKVGPGGPEGPQDGERAGGGVRGTSERRSQWKRRLGADAKEMFGSRRGKEAQDQEVLQASLYEEIGRLKMELERVKKTAGLG